MRTLTLPLLLVLLLALTGAGLPGGGPLAAGVASAHPEPGDRDGDSVKDEVDNCPDTPNGAQINTDANLANGDPQGDACDTDDDGDGVTDAAPDNCRTVANPGQENADGDRFGDACPPVDTDRDGVVDLDDNCDDVANAGQQDFDGDDKGDPCDKDYDGDKFDNDFDNCPTVYNPTTDTQPPFRQPDADGNGKGTACDPDEGLSASAPSGSSGGSGSGSATPGSATAGGAAGTAGATAKDTRKPDVTLRVARRQNGVGVRDPFVVPVGCSEACSLEARLVVDGRTAKRLGLGAREAMLAKGSWALAGKGSTYVVLAWQKRARAALRRSRSITARVIVVVRDAAGNTTTAAQAVTLRR